MKAMVLNRIVDLQQDNEPLEMVDLPEPEITDQEVLIELTACGVCHTELDEIEGRTPPPVFPMVLGHEAVGRVAAVGPSVRRHKVGDRVGVAWIFSACGQCDHCRRGDENLCDRFQATGRDAHGGYAELMKIHEDFAHLLPDGLSDIETAPLLCAGAIGYRSLRLSGLGNGQRLGLTGFGASAHLVLKLVRHLFPETSVYVFARSAKERAFALDLGAVWSGRTEEAPPEFLHAVIDTTPAWKPVVTALANLTPGGRLVINAIRKESGDRDMLLSLDYETHLWQEKEIKSVANVARRDVVEFLALAARIPIKPEVQTFPLDKANQALMELKQGNIRGAKVLVMPP